MAVSQANPRERILETAYELFLSRGFQAVGVDEVVERSGVAKATLYRHFSSKEELALAFLNLRERRWTFGWLVEEIERRGSTAEEKLLAIFDCFDEWFHQSDFRGSGFVNGLLEMKADNPVGQACVSHLANLRSVVCELARETGMADPDSFACSWHALMVGSIVDALEGNLDAARQLKPTAALVLDQRVRQAA